MKKVCSWGLVMVLLVSALILPTQAASNYYQEVETIHTEFGDFEIETTTIIYDSISRSESRNADKAASVKYDGKVIAEVTLSASFGYDGKSVRIISASSSHTTYNNWSYGSEKITKSGGTATLSATLSKLSDNDIPVSVSLTCSPTGQIS